MIEETPDATELGRKKINLIGKTGCLADCRVIKHVQIEFTDKMMLIFFADNLTLCHNQFLKQTHKTLIQVTHK